MSGSNGSGSPCALVLLVDDHPLYREALRARIANEPGLTVCGETGTVADAARLCHEYQPDLVLLDLNLPDGNGLAFLEECQGWANPPKVLVVTVSSEDGPEATEAMRLGAAGVVNKSIGGEALMHVVQQICAGQPYINDKLLGRVLRRGRG